MLFLKYINNIWRFEGAKMLDGRKVVVEDSNGVFLLKSQVGESITDVGSS